MIKALLRGCSWLPLSVSHALGVCIGMLAYYLPTDSRHITRINLHLCFPEMSEAERNLLTKASLIQTAKTACELGEIWLSPVSKALANIMSISGHEVLSDALEAGKGVIVLAPHLGNWELCGLYLDNCGPTTYLYKPPKLAAFESTMVGFRSRNGASLAPTNRKGVAMLVKALERGEIVGILPDQEPALDAGIYAPFFGVEALTMTLVSRLAARTGASVITIFARRLPAGAGFELVIGPAREGVNSEDSLTAAISLNQSVEDCVRQAPEQYQWEYKRFKSRPDQSRSAFYR